MIKTKFFDVLKTFSNEDYVRFGQFINADYFNTSIMIRKLYSLIIKYAPELFDEKLTRENFFEELYPGTKYREGTIVNLLSELYKLSEEYIAQEVYRTENYSKGRYLMKGLNTRKLDKFFVKCYEKILLELKNMKTQDEEYFFTGYEVDKDYITFLSRDSQHVKAEKIQSWHDKHIEFVLIRILSMYIYMLNQEKYTYEYKFNMVFLEYIIKFIKQHSFDHSPYILIHFNLLMLLKEDDEQFYYKLIQLLKIHGDILNGTTKWNIYVCMVNFFDTKLETGKINERYSLEVFELYRIIIEKKIYRIEEWNSQIHHSLYLNVIQSGLSQKEYQWTEKFMNDFKDELIDEHKSSTFNLCYALFYFSRKDYEQSLIYLNRVQTEDTFYYLQTKALNLQIYYERNLFEPSFSLIDSYKHFLNYNDIREANKTLHKNFADLVYKLLKIKSGRDQFEPSEFDMTGEEFIKVLKKDWVIEKVQEIQRSFDK